MTSYWSLQCLLPIRPLYKFWLIDWLIDSIECHSCLNICIFTDKSLFGRKASSFWPVVFVWIRRKKVQLWTPRIRTVCWSSYEGKSVILVDETWRSLFMELTTTSGLTGCKMYGVNGCIWPHTHTHTHKHRFNNHFSRWTWVSRLPP